MTTLAMLTLLPLASSLLACADGAAVPKGVTPIAIPGGDGGVGFDDLQFAPALGKVVVPAGRTGALVLIDPKTRAVETIEGFAKKDAFSGGHGDGTTSADSGDGLLFAIDRTAMKVVVVDPVAKKIASSAPLAADPDYVRFLASARELWVTEPDAESIEVFALGEKPTDAPRPIAKIAVAGGPEALVFDATRGRAYTHLWDGATVAIDVKERKIVARWKNGCAGSRGMVLDEARGFLIVGCAEGRAAVLDVAHDGKELSSLTAGDGVDVIAWDAKRRHVYFPGGKSATLAVIAVSEKGELSLLGTVPIAKGSHCVAADGDGRAFVGDPRGGRILEIDDQW